jgi:hypothetical protein
MLGGSRRAITAAGALGCAWVGSASAQEFCVLCSEPNALYRCVIDGARPGGSQSLQMLCITTLARSGGHGACSIKGGTVFQCSAPVVHVPWTGSDGTALAGQAPAATEPVGPANPEEPPRTMVELAKRANEQTTEQFKKAGENVKSAGQALGDATKKTWDCMVSFFTRC